MAKSKPKVVKAKPAKAQAKVKSPPPALAAADRALLDRLTARTRLSAAEVLSRALASYAAAVAPEVVEKPAKSLGPAAAAHRAPARRLFYSVDGAAEHEAKGELIFGRDPSCDVQLDLPLIADKHARLKLTEGRWLFEDLRTPRGSYKGGEPVQAVFLEDGDEIDLGGFLPVRFRVS